MLWLLLFFLLLSTVSYPQSPWRIEKIGVADGLSEGNTYFIHQDKKGFIWIGTHGGLNRYDGYNFRVFQYEPFNSSSLGDNAAFFLKEDPVTGRFWIGGSSSLNEFDPVTFKNTRYTNTSKQMEFADGIFINRNEMLLACEYAVRLFNTTTKTFTDIPVYDENEKLISVSRVENALRDRAGNFMIMSRRGIFFYDPLTKSCKRKTNSPDFSPFYNYEVFNVLNDSRGHYWIATNKKGIIRFDAVTGKYQTVQLPSPYKIESTRFDVISEDSKGNIWAGSSNGLFRIDPSTLMVDEFTSDKTKDVYLSHDEVNVITEDSNNILWVGTVGGGINKLVKRGSGFKNFTLVNGKNGGKIGTYIMGMQQLNDELWFINIWDQVGRINMKTGDADLITHAIQSAGYSWYSEGAILKYKKDQLKLLNGESSFAIAPGAGSNVNVREVHAPGLSYIFTAGNKTWYMVKAATEKIFFSRDTIYGNQFFYDAVEDLNGNIWIGTSKGLVKFDTRKNEFHQFQHDDRNVNSISSDYIYSVELDNERKTLWMAAYNGGLCSYTIGADSFRYYNKEHGLSDNIVYALEKDHHGNFWFSTNAGISSYNTATKTFRNFGVADGLLNYEFNRRSSYKNEKGYIFFGGISGIDYFHPDSLTKNFIKPNLAFSGFRIFNNDYLPAEKNSLPVIELDHNDRYLTIDFASLNFNDQQKIQYAYRVNDNEWIKTGTQHILSFSDLAIGEHRLWVRSTNSEGVWQDNAIECLIIVHPPWWQTWWFRIAAGVLALVVIVGAIRLYYRRKLEKQKVKLEKQQAIEKERTRIATDMHDDLGAGLSRIKFLSETIGLKKQKQLAIEEDINSIRTYSLQMIDKMGEIVWALNEKNDSLSDLLSYTRAYAVEYLSQNGIDCEIDMPDQFPAHFLSGEFRRNVFLTVKEALHNVVKHAECSKVNIRMQAETQLQVSIHDNGKGIDKNNIRAFSNGIFNMEKRITEIGGQLRISNDNGTMVAFTVPLSI